MQGKHDHGSWDDAGTERPRVLIECPSTASPSIIADLVSRSGYEVRTCVGPDDRGHRCDLLDEGACELVSGADVVVNMLGVRKDAGSRVAEAVLSERRPPKVVVEIAQPDVPVTGVDLQAAEVVSTPVHAGQLLRAIRRALGRATGPSTWWGDGAP